jgi:hypothetical protein
LFAVTFCDLAGAKENNLRRLQARLEALAKPYFRGICFVANGDADLAAAASRNKALFVQIQYLAYQFEMERYGKAMAIVHRVMAKAAARASPVTQDERDGLNGHAVAEASKDLFNGDWLAALKLPLPEGALAKPIILRNGHASGAAAIAAARKTAPASHSLATGEKSKERPRRWTKAGAAAAMAATAILAVMQFGPVGTGKNPVSNPSLSASRTVEQSTTEKVETRRKAEAESAAAEEYRRAQAEAAAAEAHGKAVAEAAAAGERREAQAEAAAAEARGMAVAEAAAAGERREAQAEAAAAEARGMAVAEAAADEERRNAQANAAAEPDRPKNADAGRRRKARTEASERRGHAVAEAALRQYGGGPIMHGISQ